MHLRRVLTLAGLLLLSIAIASGIGATNSGNIFSFFFGDLSQIQREIFLELRLPRVVAAILAGFLISIAGLLMQRTFNNPLAEPTILGTTAAASLGSVIALLLGASLAQPIWVFVFAFLASILASSSIVYQDLRRTTSGPLLIIYGFALAAILNGVIAILAAISGSEEIRSVAFWTSGTLAFARPSTLMILTVALAITTIALWRNFDRLDLLVFNNIQITLLGHSPAKLRLIAMSIVSLAVSATVVSMGAVAFLGLAAPHIARLLFGESIKDNFVATGLIGSILLLWSDTIARTISAPAEMPISVITSLIGAPILLFLVARMKRTLNA